MLLHNLYGAAALSAFASLFFLSLSKVFYPLFWLYSLYLFCTHVDHRLRTFTLLHPDPYEFD